MIVLFCASDCLGDAGHCIGSFNVTLTNGKPSPVGKAMLVQSTDVYNRLSVLKAFLCNIKASPTYFIKKTVTDF